MVRGFGVTISFRSRQSAAVARLAMRMPWPARPRGSDEASSCAHRLSIFGKIPARPLGVITVPDDEATARTKAIEYFHIEPALQFRVVVTKLEKVKERSGAG